jgi:glycine/D-amino acid oxidase-like deaminating enzyme
MRQIESIDVLVIGGGIAGLATAWHLARRGRRVLVCEREAAVFTRSSGVNAGILRAVVEDASIAGVAAAGARALLEPDAELSERTFVDPVGVFLCADRADAAEHLEAMVRLSSVHVRPVAPQAVRARAPHVATDFIAAWESPQEGVIDLERLAQSLVHATERRGGRVRASSRVERLLTSGSRVCGVALEGGAEILAETVVLAAGGWAQLVAQSAGSPVVLQPTRRHAALLTTPVPVDPRGPIVWNNGSSFYSRPLRGGLLVCDCDQTEVDPESARVEPAAVAHLERSVRRHLAAPWNAGRLDPWIGLRTFAGDHRFAIGRDPLLGGLVWAAALGGHGITCGLEVGRLATCAVLDEHDDALAALHPARAARGLTHH